MSQPVRIAPSLLSADFSQLGQALQCLNASGADWVHLDVMDGHFVPNLTFGPPVIKALRPHSTLPFDVHLMIEQPDRTLADYRAAGADSITVHAEACTHLQRTLAEIRWLGARAGVSLNPATPLSCIEDVLDDLDLVLIMSVNPGFGGQQFIPQAVDKIKRLKAMLAARGLSNTIDIEVDGGINAQTAPLVIAAGATVLVSGSALFNAPDFTQAVAMLRSST